MSYNSNLQSKNTKIQSLIDKANALPDKTNGVELPTLSNPAENSEIFLNKEVIGQNGQIKTGTFTLANELDTQDDLIAQIQVALESKASGGQITPIISINSDGLITAIAGDKTATKQLTTKAATTITPTTTSQIAVSAGTYVTGDITVAAAESSGSSTDTRFADLAMGMLTGIDDDSITSLRQYAFAYSTELKTARLSGVTIMPNSVFRGCPNLESADLSNVTGTLGAYTFMDCPKLKSINVLSATNSSTSLCQNCVELERVEFGNMKTIGTSSFSGCTKLTTLIIRREGTSVTNLSNVNAFNNTPIANKTGYIYVPSSLIDKFKAATNWTAYATQIRAIEDYPEICG